MPQDNLPQTTHLSVSAENKSLREVLIEIAKQSNIRFVFNDALDKMFDGGWAAANQIKIALLKTSTTPTKSDASTNLGDYTEATSTSGNYPAGGSVLDTWGNMITRSANKVIFDDTGASVNWAQSSSNPPAVRWGFIYNDTIASDPGIAYIDLGASVDMTAGDLTITWDASSGIFTVTNA